MLLAFLLEDTMIQPSEILEEVDRILCEGACGKGEEPCPLSSYQVLNRLDVRDQLIQERGMPGSGSGSHYSAAHVVAKALDMLVDQGRATASFMDSNGIQFEVAGQFVPGGYGSICKLYQYRPAQENT
jgi:hypothetical protein